MNIGIFGFAIPHGLFTRHKITVHNLTLTQDDRPSEVDAFIEPFMDPFAVNFLRRLGNGALTDFGAIIMMRDCPGALVAYHYACQLQNMGLLPNPVPDLILCNLTTSTEPAVQHFNHQELNNLRGRLTPFIHTGTPAKHNAATPDLIQMQSTGQITGAEAFAAWTTHSQPIANPRTAGGTGPRMALFGAPLGNDQLHHVLDQAGVLAVDQQCMASAWLAQNPTPEGFAGNPWAARQSADLFLDQTESTLTEHRISKLLWQLDPHDDLWGWLAPDLRKICQRLNCDFVDLGFLPRWPTQTDLSKTISQVTA